MATKKPIDWAQVNARLPHEKTPEQKKKRAELFASMDNGNHYLSLAEVDKGIRDVLKLDNVFDCKPAIIRAFTAARKIAARKTKHSDDYITLPEFRLFLLYLRQYFEYYVMFQQIDTSSDGRVSFTEFQKAIPLMARWGLKVADPKAEFAKIDTNKGGFILFEEFCDHAITKALDLDDDLD